MELSCSLPFAACSPEGDKPDLLRDREERASLSLTRVYRAYAQKKGGGRGRDGAGCRLF